MKTIRLGDRGLEVLSLQCSLPDVTRDGIFGPGTEKAVKEFQESHGVTVDGIVGPSSWSLLLPSRPDKDWEKVAGELGVEVAILKALAKVESGGRGYLPSGLPAILFEAHLFYRQLSREGKNPEILMKSHPKIISKTWRRDLYKGGEGEVSRFNEAFSISPVAALRSTSFGEFQIIPGFMDPWEFYNLIWSGQGLELLGRFLRSSSILPAMRSKNFREIARRYNGPGYEKNQYHIKLQKAYNDYSK